MKKEVYGFFFEFIRTNVQLIIELTEQEQIIFNLIKNSKKISKSELALRIGKSEKTVQRVIAPLINKDLIIRIGSNKDGYWTVKDN